MAFPNGKGGGVASCGDMDWLCKMCRERNFSRRGDCFKCRMPRPPDAELVQAPSMSAPPNGSTLTGMVKSYNKKGFGFIMVFGHNSPDVYYTRENVSQRLMHPDMPGEQVTFELFRERGKLIAKNIRPLGDEQSKGGNKGMIGAREQISSQRSNDEGQWKCPFCSEHNFCRRMECFKCKIPKPTGAPTAGFSEAPTNAPARPAYLPVIPPRKTFSPHAGARAIRESLREEMAAKAAAGGGRRSGSSGSSSSSDKRKTKNTKRKRSSSSSSSSSKKKDKKDKGKKRRSRSSSSSASSSSVGVVEKGDKLAASCSGNSEIDKAKADALKHLTRLQGVEPKDARMSEFRSLLREWHPDKNPDRVELATAVFQFLQKGKALMQL